MQMYIRDILYIMDMMYYYIKDDNFIYIYRIEYSNL